MGLGELTKLWKAAKKEAYLERKLLAEFVAAGGHRNSEEEGEASNGECGLLCKDGRDRVGCRAGGDRY